MNRLLLPTLVAFGSLTSSVAANTDEGSVARPQTPLAPFPYRVETVRFAGAAPAVQLAGSLTLPVTSRKVPAVVLVHGSGPVDRDSSMLGHKLFLVIADALTRAGYGVLRYDKRGVGESTGDFRAATTLDLAHDAGAAIAYLRSRPEIDASRVALVGHSEGGTIAGLLCGEDQAPAACVSLAGMIAPYAAQLPLQEALTGKDLGADASYEKVVNAFYDRVSAALRIDDDPQRLERMSAISAEWRARFPEGNVNHEAAADSLLARPKLIASDWFRTLMQLDVASAVRRGTRPILFVNGSTDRQVVAEPNLRTAREAIGKETPLRHTELLPGLNHLLQESATGSSDEYGELTQTMSPIVIRRVVEFLELAMTKSGASGLLLD